MSETTSSGVQESATSPSSSNTVQYNVSVVTGDFKISNGGTDYDVFITINGSLNSSGEILLNSQNNNNEPKKNDKALFEKNTTDTFTIKTPNSLGKLQSVIVRSPKKGDMIYSDWALNQIIITYKEDNDNKTETFTLKAKKIDKSDPVTISVDPPAVSAADATGPVYTVTVKTADENFAGTDANITLVLYGNANEATIALTDKISIIPEGQTKKNSNLFERNQTDAFQFQTPDLGSTLQKIRVKSDGGDSWKIESITIEGNSFSPNSKIVFKYAGEINNKMEVELKPGDNAVMTKDSAQVSSKSTPTQQKKKSLASMLRESAAQEYITQQLKTQFAALSGELAEKCDKCNTINPTDWKSNNCEEVCVPLEESASNNRGLFKKRSELLKQLENVTTAQLQKILPDSKDRAFFYNKYFYERLKQSGSFQDSLMDMNDKLEEFITKVGEIYNEYDSKDSALSSSQDERIKKNTTIKLNYNKSPVEYYFRPTQETYEDLSQLSSSVSSLSDEELYCKRRKWLSCAVRSHKCDWVGERHEKNMCKPISSAPAAAPAAANPDPNQPPPVSGGNRNISKQKKKIVRNLSKRRYF